MMATLTGKQLDQFANILRTRRDALRQIVHDALLATDRSDFVELAGQVRDAGDESMADLLVGMNVDQIQRELAELAEVEAALERIREETYGVCTDCGDEVGVDRLAAWPTAKRCLTCQARYETNRRGGRDATPSL